MDLRETYGVIKLYDYEGTLKSFKIIKLSQKRKLQGIMKLKRKRKL